MHEKFTRGKLFSIGAEKPQQQQGHLMMSKLRIYMQERRVNYLMREQQIELAAAKRANEAAMQLGAQLVTAGMALSAMKLAAA